MSATLLPGHALLCSGSKCTFCMQKDAPVGLAFTVTSISERSGLHAHRAALSEAGVPSHIQDHILSAIASFEQSSSGCMHNWVPHAYAHVAQLAAHREVSQTSAAHTADLTAKSHEPQRGGTLLQCRLALSGVHCRSVSEVRGTRAAPVVLSALRRSDAAATTQGHNAEGHLVQHVGTAAVKPQLAVAAVASKRRSGSQAAKLRAAQPILSLIDPRTGMAVPEQRHAALCGTPGARPCRARHSLLLHEGVRAAACFVLAGAAALWVALLVWATFCCVALVVRMVLGVFGCGRGRHGADESDDEVHGMKGAQNGMNGAVKQGKDGAKPGKAASYWHADSAAAPLLQADGDSDDDGDTPPVSSTYLKD